MNKANPRERERERENHGCRDLESNRRLGEEREGERARSANGREVLGL